MVEEIHNIMEEKLVKVKNQCTGFLCIANNYKIMSLFKNNFIYFSVSGARKTGQLHVKE